MLRSLPCGLLAVLALFPLPGQAEAFLPSRDSEVLERLPARSDPGQRELARMRAGLRQEPANLTLAAELARRYLALARKDGDPRHLGYAQSVLGPWWNMPRPPAEVQLLRATIRQSTHQFDAALRDLDELVRNDGSNAQAWLTRATVQQVTGDFDGARHSCARLQGIAPALVAQTCLAAVDNLNGAARTSYATLLAAYTAQRGSPTEVDEWVLTLLGEMAARRGDAGAARQHFGAALALAPTDAYTLGACADVLLDQGQPGQAAALLRGREKVDALLLRLAIALDRLGAPDAAAARTALRDRFRAAALRGDTVHRREEARYALHLERDAGAALRLARANWAVQKEPADVRILLEAGIAAGNNEAVADALSWIDRVGLEDAALARLRAQASATRTARLR
ncbi:hypothetical protein KBW95_08440 [Massilia sp. ZL223]|nr:hypothetical protein [Massilia sp. ZL223]